MLRCTTQKRKAETLSAYTRMISRNADSPTADIRVATFAADHRIFIEFDQAPVGVLYLFDTLNRPFGRPMHVRSFSCLQRILPPGAGDGYFDHEFKSATEAGGNAIRAAA